MTEPTDTELRARHQACLRELERIRALIAARQGRFPQDPNVDLEDWGHTQREKELIALNNTPSYEEACHIHSLRMHGLKAR